MKSFLISVLMLFICVHGYGQVQKVVFDCLDDIRSGGSRVQYSNSSDTIKLSLTTYGPCEADFDIRLREVEISGVSNVFLDIYDKCETYESGKLECGCLFLIQFELVGYQLKPNFREFIVKNKILPKRVWEEWFWDNID